MFTLIDRDGKSMYGMCMRNLFQGEDKRYDVKRRPRHCLCFITRNPFISLFRTLLLEIHALSMIEQQQGSAKGFIELAYNQSLYAIQEKKLPRITISRSALPDLARDFNIIPPKYSRLSRVATILPLLEALGAEKFLSILSAVLCERKIILIADETSTLITAVHAMGAMLHPFQWQYICVPLLSSKLLNYVSAKIPYIMGVRRYLYQQLLKESLNDVILVDIDRGEYRIMGGASITDFVGESGTALKQATESLDRVRQRASDMASMFLRSSITAETDNGPRDLVTVIVNELRTAIANKPGGSSVASVASGLFRGLPGGIKSTVEESKATWVLETEKLLKDTQLQFFVYLFADIDEYLTESSLSTPTNFIADFDRANFMQKRSSSAVGDSKAMLDFLSDFFRSKMFIQFCNEKMMEKIERTTGMACVDWGKGQDRPKGFTKENYKVDVVHEEDDFHSICSDIRLNGLPTSVASVRSCVSNRTARTATALNIDNADGSCKGLIGMDFDILTVQYTLGQNIYVNNNNPTNQNNVSDDTTLELKICEDSHNSDTFFKIMNTITLRFENCKAANCRGTNGSYGVRAMNLLRALLILGPEGILSASIDYIPIIRILINMCGTNANNVNSVNQGLDFTSLGSVFDIRPIGMAVLSLLVDHKKLILQRKYALLCKDNVYPYLLYQSPSSSSSLFSPSDHPKGYKKQSELIRKELFTIVTQAGVSSNSGSKQFPKFNSLHNSFKPVGAVSIDPSKLILTEAVEGSSEKRDDNDNDDDIIDNIDDMSGRDRDSERDVIAPLVSTYHHSQISSIIPIKIKTENVNLLDSTYDSYSNQPVLTPSTPSSNPMMSTFQSTSCSNILLNNNNNNNNSHNNNNNNQTLSSNQMSYSNPSISSSFTSTASTNNSNSFIPTHSSNSSFDTKVINDPFDEESVYRIVNKDTGEVSDLRDLDKMMSMAKVVNTPQKESFSLIKSPPNSASHSFVPTLPPPPSGQVRRVPVHSNPNPISIKSTNLNINGHNNNGNGNGNGNGSGPRTDSGMNIMDPFATLKPLIPNSPVKSPKGSGPNQGSTDPRSTDPFNFSAFNFPTTTGNSGNVSSFVPSSSASAQLTSPFSTFKSDGIVTAQSVSLPLTASVHDAFSPSTSKNVSRRPSAQVPVCSNIGSGNGNGNDIINPFLGFDLSTAPQGQGERGGGGGGGVVGMKQPIMNMSVNMNGIKACPMGINSQQIARDKDRSNSDGGGGGSGGDPFADLLGNMKN